MKYLIITLTKPTKSIEIKYQNQKPYIYNYFEFSKRRALNEGLNAVLSNLQRIA